MQDDGMSGKGMVYGSFFLKIRYRFGMVRVVNVERVLKKAAYRGNGQVILGITNSVLPQNNGSYWIRFTNGTLTAIERMPQDQVP